MFCESDIFVVKEVIEMLRCLREVLHVILLLLSIHAVDHRICKSNKVLGRDCNVIEGLYCCASHYLFGLVIRKYVLGSM